ncbi:MAG: formyltetrahydrofolate deformylase [Sandaracinaceae bacterium]|nr:formyltetrahydrofolate deformylase [Sandaracinaceae bacterium]
MSSFATLLVSCPDRKGLVASLAQVLYGHGANIVDADQHTDAVAGQFFQRIHFDMSDIHTDRTSLESAIREVAARFEMAFRLTRSDAVKRVGIFVSKYDHCLYDLLLRQRSGELDCEIPLIISNHEDLRPVAEQFGVRFEHLPVTKATKAQQEQEALRLLRAEGVGLAVLARYMQILSDDFLRAFEGDVINIHHSFLPAFVGGKPYHRAYERGVKLIGATAHFATADLDEGPIIEQDVVRCSHRDKVDDLVRKGRDLEKVVLARAVRLHLADRVLVYGNKTVVFD